MRMKDDKVVRIATSTEGQHMNKASSGRGEAFCWNSHANVKILGGLRHEVKFTLGSN